MMVFFMRIKTTVSAHALIVRNEPSTFQQQVLLVCLAYKDHRWQHWCFPGGYVDEEEDITTALCREVMEETGLKLISWEQVGVAPLLEQKKPNISFIFRCESWEGEAKACSRELIEVAWISEDKFRAMAHEGGPLAYPSHMCKQVETIGWNISVQKKEQDQ
jgi:8-oxo-dGTP pyrophosphatase MutT (NUDIX family)